MLVFCPYCGSMLQIEEGDSCMQFSCPSCPYVCPVTKKVSSRVYPKLKDLEEVLGGPSVWDNAQVTNERCPKCSHERAYFMQIQTRIILDNRHPVFPLAEYMHLLKKVIFNKGHEPRSVSPEPTSSQAPVTIEEVEEKADDDQKDSNTVKFTDLPSEIQMNILKCLSYDDIAKLRRTCKLMNTLCSYLLNRGFQQLGVDIDREKLRIKRELPRRESMRRSHRLSRLNDAYAGLDTRFSIMTMTYRKFIDMKASCFIPGKVLDEFFRIIDILKKSHDRGGTLTIDIHELLKDLRDLSSMAMEHFEEHVQPSLTTSTSSALTSSYFMTIHPSLFRATTTPTTSPSRDLDTCEWRKNVMDKLAQQEKQIRKQNTEILSLKSCIRRLVLVCTEMISPGSEKEVGDLLTDVLSTVTTGSASCCVHEELPSTSSTPTLDGGSAPRRKRFYEEQYSQELCPRKKPRSEDPADESRIRERLI